MLRAASVVALAAASLDSKHHHRLMTASGYTHLPATCVHSSNIELHKGKTVAECAAICDANPSCLAFEYGVEYGGGGSYEAGDCQEQSSAEVTDCSGTYNNLDLYVKDGGTTGGSSDTCQRPSWGCDVSHDIYTNIDCDGDGILDHMCTTTINSNRWLVLSSEGCPQDWGTSSRAATECDPTTYVDGCALYIAGPIVASKGNQVATADSLQDYELTFTMELASDWSITGSWQSILHIGDSNSRRAPGLWFHNYENALYVRHAYSPCCNSWGPTTTGVTFTAGETYDIKMVVQNNQMTVYVDGVSVGTASGSSTYVATGVAVHVGDPWYDTAKVTLSDITLSEIALADTCRANIAATTAGTCFSDDFSSIDSGWISVEGDWSWSGGTVGNADAYGDGDVLYMDADYDDGYLETSVGVSNAQGSGNEAGLLFRIADMPSAANYVNNAGQMYYCGILPNYQEVLCGRMNNNWSELFTYYTTIAYGQFYDLGINMDGSHFTVFLDGAEIGSFSDSTYSSGGIGLRARYARGIYNSVSFKPPGCTMPTTTTGTGYTFQAGRCYPQSEASVINTAGSMGGGLMGAGSPKECYDWCVVNYNEYDNWDAGIITHYDIKTFMGLDLRVASRSWDGSYGHECMCNRPGGRGCGA